MSSGVLGGGGGGRETREESTEGVDLRHGVSMDEERLCWVDGDADGGRGTFTYRLTYRMHAYNKRGTAREIDSAVRNRIFALLSLFNWLPSQLHVCHVLKLIFFFLFVYI